VATDFVIGSGFENLTGVELVLKFGKPRVARDVDRNAGEKDFRAPREKRGIKLRAADHIKLATIGGLLNL
jgi:hypothetical protein